LMWGLSGSRLSDGLQALESYVRKHPGDAAGHYDLAQLLWRSDPDRALNELTAAVRASTTFAAARLARGWLLYRMGRAAESLPDLLAADQANPNDPRVLTQIGLVYLALDRHADSEKALRQALALAPEDPETLLHLGRCLMAMDRTDEAQGFLNQFQKLRPQFVRGLRKEAGLIEMASMPEAKRIRYNIERLRREATSHPGDPELRLNLATLLLANGNTGEAMHEFRELLSGRGDHGILRKAGATLVAARQYGPARELLERAAVEDGEARIELAWAVFCMDGLQSGSRVLESVPEGSRSADYFLLYARMLETSGQKEESARMLQQGLRIHPSHPEFARQASFLLLRHGRNSDAIHLLKQAVQKIPDDPDLLLRLAVALAVAGETSAAEKGMREIEAKWPEWERPYLLHGVLLERTLPLEARQKFQTALALGLSGETMLCAKARVDPSRVFDSKCTCFSGLLDWFEEACSGGEK
jgi:tetratricopeptide (TPR) repeat protein